MHTPSASSSYRKVQLAFGLAVAALIVVEVFSYANVARSARSDASVRHIHEVIGGLESLLVSIENARSEQHGFVATGQEAYLASYRASVIEAWQREAAVRSLVTANPEQVQQLPLLAEAIARAVQHMDRVTIARREQGFSAATALLQGSEGYAALAEVRQRVHQAQREERRLLVLRSAEAERRASDIVVVRWVGIGFGLAFAVAAGWLLRREHLRRERAEALLREGEAQYRGLLEAAPDAMVVFDQAGTIVLVNHYTEEAFGYGRTDLVGGHIDRLVPEGLAAMLAVGAQGSTAERAAAQAVAVVLTGQRQDGSTLPVEIMVSPLTTAKGTLVTAAIRDVSRRHAAEAELRASVAELSQSNEELRQFAYVASHDLQEPLRMVASFTQLLSRRYRGKLDSDADDFIGFAVDGAARMQRLIQDLLAYSRVGTQGKTMLGVSSEHALEQALMNLRAAINDTGAQVTYDPLPAVLADDSQLIQLFQNLVGNAIKYHSPASPRVHVSAAMNGDINWMFSVQDNGLGIEPQYFERIFGMFQRLHTREAFAGTGIGLAICKKIVERHGGTLSVESQLGAGSTFRFGLRPAAES